MNGAGRVSVCVCVCTYRRPDLLKCTLEHLAGQVLPEGVDCSIVVADNDYNSSARSVVEEFGACNQVPTTYCVEPRQNIALARNRALSVATSEFVAFIDDDEFPASDWLATLLKAIMTHNADGVLGPVRPFFPGEPPAWLITGKFWERPEHETGLVLKWQQTRTGNVLFRRSIIVGKPSPFDEDLGAGGEDQDFFRRSMENGHIFIWCNEAVVYEVVPPERWKRMYLLKRALLRGQNERKFLTPSSIAKSLVAVPVYATILLFVWVLGQHVFMRFAIRLCDHSGKLLVAMGFKPIKEANR
jgi:glycosyltransferase involved in cell wall biosynthesis